MTTSTRSALAVPAFLALLVTLAAPRAAAQDESDPSADPGAAHQRLMQRAGSYTTIQRFSMDPSMKPQEIKGEATLRPILGGRFLLHEEKGTMMGRPTEHLRLWGFNSGTGRHEATWMFTGSTAMMRMTGTSPDGGKSVRYEATYGGEPTKFEVTVVEKDADTFVVTLIAKQDDGSNGPTFETTYTRRK